MCIAVLNKTGIIQKDTFDIMYENNTDGIGFAFADGTNVQIYKTLKDVDKLYEQYATKRKNNKYPFLIHARIKTHGKTDLQNVHPFLVFKDMALIHNGIVDAPNVEPSKSDTWHLVQWIRCLKNPYNIFVDGSMESAWMDVMVGSYNKVAVLRGNGQYKIFGEKLGHWNKKNWYSNNTYKQYGVYDRGGKSYSYNPSNSTCDVDDVRTTMYATMFEDEPYVHSSNKKTNVSEYDMKIAILYAFGHKPYTMNYTERDAIINEYKKDFKTTLKELYEEINAWSEL